MSTAKRSNSGVARGWAGVIAVVCLGVIAAAWPSPAAACPFCKAIQPTLCQLREQAAIAALAELRSQAGSKPSSLQLHRVLRGAERLGAVETLEVALDVVARPGALLLIFGTGPPEAPPNALAWHAVVVTETSYAYFARAPSLKVAAAERLAYFTPFLEHADPVIAEDAYFEFGHATFDEVERAAGSLPLARMRKWLTDARVTPQRKGFYAVALGLARDARDRRENAQLLRGLILEPDDDFRAGFDGILGGYLLLTGGEGLELIETRYLADPRSADGDVRHALAALRFAHEYVREIPVERLHAAVRRLLDRPPFTAAAITDLARLRDWSARERISRLYTQREYSDPAIRRAIVGYLLASPEPAAREALSRLRAMDPAGVAAAEQFLSRTSDVGPEGR